MRKVLETLQRRHEWLSYRMMEIGGNNEKYFHRCNQEAVALRHAMDLVEIEIERTAPQEVAA